MKILLCLATEERHAQNTGGSNVDIYGVDCIASLFL